MHGYNEFEGKTLDEAMAKASSYYNLPREKLEIEILHDAKTGIFGLMGTRKAKITARRAQIEVPHSRNHEPAPAENETAKSEAPVPANGKAPRAKAPAPAENIFKARAKTAALAPEKTAPAEGSLPIAHEAKSASPEKDKITPEESLEDTRLQRRRVSRQKRDLQEKRLPSADAPRTAAPSPAPVSDDEPLDTLADDMADGLPLVSLDSLDQEKLSLCSLETVEKLTRPIIGEVVYSVGVADNRVRVSIDCGEDFSLLIGREGQTLSALQYMSSRIISRRMDATVRVQLEGGNYRERQNEKLKALALDLARKLRESGKVQYTRPLSSYQRRIIHMALQEEPDLTTRSKGDGPLKRVAVMKKK